jgi:dihydroxyacetone kinase-like protein
LCGYVGNGMCDICVVGDIFAAPGPQACVDAFKIADQGKGVLYIVFNHAGDMLSAGVAMNTVKKEKLNVKMVVAQEDISNAPRDQNDDRRGLVGGVALFKIAGAAAADGKSLEDVHAITSRFADNMATIAVAARGATHPATGDYISKLGEDEMEIGMGQHGEGGGNRQKMKSADDTAVEMLDLLLNDLNVKAGEDLLLILNGSGATTLMELFIVLRKCESYLREKKITIIANHIGEVLTVQEQAGFQMFIARMDDELLRYWNAPCDTPYFKKI